MKTLSLIRWRAALSYASPRVLALVAAAAALAFAPNAAAPHDGHARSGGDGFQAAMEAAMARMHSGMDLPFSGDADRDFARMMIPHHQGAIDMAIAELRHGKDERLRRLAQEIIVEQQQEIAVMHLALGDAVSAASPSPTQIAPAGETSKEP